MYFGKVIGTVWATQKSDSLIGEGLQFVQPINADYRTVGKPLVAINSIGAGVGEIVIYVTSSEASIPIKLKKNSLMIPTDATIVGIVDRIDLSPIV